MDRTTTAPAMPVQQPPGNHHLGVSDWLKIAGLVMAMLTPPLTYLFAKAAIAQENYQHNRYQDEVIAELKETVRQVPELLVEVRHLIRSGAAPAPSSGPPTPGKMAAQKKPDEAAKPRDVARQVKDLLDLLRQRRKCRERHGTPPPPDPPKPAAPAEPSPRPLPPKPNI